MSCSVLILILLSFSDEFNLSGVAEMREEEEGTFHEVINEETVTLQGFRLIWKLCGPIV